MAFDAAKQRPLLQPIEEDKLAVTAESENKMSEFENLMIQNG